MKTQLLTLALLLAPSAAGAEPPIQRPPECNAMGGLSEGFADAFIELGLVLYGIFTRVIPDAGVAHDFSSETSWAQLSWPLDFAFAPETGRREYPRKCTDDVVMKANGSRLLLEPMLRFGSIGDGLAVRFHLRPGYRFLYRTSTSKVGFGAGLGSTFDFAGGFEPSLSPELVVSFGECCDPGYITIAARFDRYFESARNVGSLQIGWTFH